jgi:hypothetical protein
VEGAEGRGCCRFTLLMWTRSEVRVDSKSYVDQLAFRAAAHCPQGVRWARKRVHPPPSSVAPGTHQVCTPPRCKFGGGGAQPTQDVLRQLPARIWSLDSGNASNREKPATTRTRGGAAGVWGRSESWETSWLSVLLSRTPRPGVALPLRNHVSGLPKRTFAGAPRSEGSAWRCGA